jgi:hypothetical protein
MKLRVMTRPFPVAAPGRPLWSAGAVRVSLSHPDKQRIDPDQSLSAAADAEIKEKWRSPF